MEQLSHPLSLTTWCLAAAERFRIFSALGKLNFRTFRRTFRRQLAFVEKARGSVAAALACLARIVHRPALPDAALFGGIRT